MKAQPKQQPKATAADANKAKSQLAVKVKQQVNQEVLKK